jgi:hypothetical protein
MGHRQHANCTCHHITPDARLFRAVFSAPPYPARHALLDPFPHSFASFPPSCFNWADRIYTGQSLTKRPKARLFPASLPSQ